MQTLSASKKRRRQGGGLTEANQLVDMMWREEQRRTFPCINERKPVLRSVTQTPKRFNFVERDGEC